VRTYLPSTATIRQCHTKSILITIIIITIIIIIISSSSSSSSNSTGITFLVLKYFYFHQLIGIIAGFSITAD
jgi:hypothetical protein